MSANAPSPKTEVPPALPKTRLFVATVGVMLFVGLATAAKGKHTFTLPELLGAGLAPVLFGLVVWALVSVVRGGKFRASWRAYEISILLCAAISYVGLIGNHAAK